MPRPNNFQNCATLKVYTFVDRGYKFSRFCEFFSRSQSLYPRNCFFSATRESLYTQNLTFEVTREILIKTYKKIVKVRMIIRKFSRNFPRSRMFIHAEYFNGPIRESLYSQKFILALGDHESLSPRKSIPIK